MVSQKQQCLDEMGQNEGEQRRDLVEDQLTTGIVLKRIDRLCISHRGENTKLQRVGKEISHLERGARVVHGPCWTVPRDEERFAADIFRVAAQRVLE